MSKPKLKATLKKIYEVDYKDLENFAREVYGLNYNFVAAQEGQNDSTYSFMVHKKVADYDKAEADLIRKGIEPKYMNNHVLLDVLCEDGYIKPGEYNVSVCW